MRIGIDIRNIGKKRTGDEAVFFNLVKNLAVIDNENEYRLLTDIRDSATILKIKKNLAIDDRTNFEIVSLTAFFPLRNKFGWNIWTLPKYLRENPVDIFHTQYVTPFFVPKKTKIITTIHDISFNFFPQFIKIADLLFLKILIPISLRRADKIIAVSKFTRDEIIEYYTIRPEKIDWVYNAARDDFSEKAVLPRQLEEIRKKYELPERFIFYIGTMQPRKNLPCLVEAYGKANQKLPDLKLVLAGSRGAYNFDKEIGKRVHKLSLSENVIFTDYISEDEKLAFFKLAMVFCFPSFYEGFGIPILEAMRAGTPVIASDIAVHREVAGAAALFFAGNSSDDLAEKIYQFCTDENLRATLREKGALQAEKFSWRSSAEKMLDIYAKLGHT